ncbi:type VII toxin-antitoxin system MntA family adenylyltransferase antitoxin [Lentibacillus sp. Marseille-P4043]|uniref:type VII toxin-antitoxin system MntA family adenylyltransferase antitoxin n=1 Tax=Lentibacillus sp. Marseille-P4043 TaxID=2040293 RepID=UPI000D0B68B8|nr:nucleotidyltransferase domain-containing protein [Lentibacillus sp. Marseille-P4043]
MINQRLKDQLYTTGQSMNAINKIILFGSRAVGDNTEKSDIDLAFIAPTMSEKEWNEFSFDLEEKLDTLLLVDLIKFENAPTELKNEIMKFGKTLYSAD